MLAGQKEPASKVKSMTPASPAPHATPPASYWPMVLIASAILMITMGVRQSLGLYISPINTSTGLGIASISFALAIGQFMWGASQPIFGAVADRYGPGGSLFTGAAMLVLGLALTPFVSTEFGLTMCLGVLVAGGAGAGSFSILIGAMAQRLPPQKRAFASGFINAGGSFGQFLFAPLSQFLIAGFGWMTALFSLAAISLATIPLSWPLRKKVEHPVSTAGADPGLKQQLRVALKDRSYWCLHAGFFTCGFHIAFLVTHLPGAVDLCGLPANVSAMSLALIGLANIVGSLGAGALGQHLPDEVDPGAHVRIPGGAGCLVSDGAQDGMDLLRLLHRSGLDLAGHGAADGRVGRQAVRLALSGDAVWPDPAVAPDRRLLRCLAGRAGIGESGQL